MAAFKVRREATPKFAGGPALAAARLRSWCVFALGCPVVSVHGSFGLALHTGQRTDRICLSDSWFKAHHNFLICAVVVSAGTNAIPPRAD